MELDSAEQWLRALFAGAATCGFYPCRSDIELSVANAVLPEECRLVEEVTPDLLQYLCDEGYLRKVVLTRIDLPTYYCLIVDGSSRPPVPARCSFLYRPCPAG